MPAAVAEACLAHVPRNQVVQAYQRSDLLMLRTEVLQAWSDYIKLRYTTVGADQRVHISSVAAPDDKVADNRSLVKSRE